MKYTKNNMIKTNKDNTIYTIDTCHKCGNPEDMYYCHECGEYNKTNTCVLCGKTVITIDNDYHNNCI